MTRDVRFPRRPKYITYIRRKDSVCFDFISCSDPIFRLASPRGRKRHGNGTRWPPPRRIDISQTSGSGIEIQFMDWAWAIRITLRARFLSDNPRARGPSNRANGERTSDLIAWVYARARYFPLGALRLTASKLETIFLFHCRRFHEANASSESTDLSRSGRKREYVYVWMSY